MSERRPKPVPTGENLMDPDHLFRTFYRRQRHFSPDAQAFIADSSSAFMEEDIRLKLKNDPEKVIEFTNKLRSYNLKNNDVWLTLTFFGLPYTANDSQ